MRKLRRAVKVGVVGATGEVGRTMVKVLEERDHVFSQLRLFASRRSVGNTIEFNSKKVTVEELTENAMREDFDFFLFSAGKEISKKFAPLAAMHGATVIDNSSAFRMDPSIPLVVPEINSDILNGYGGIIANPNCSTIQLVLALNPLHVRYNLKRVVVTTMQAVSGSGYKGINELKSQILDNHMEPNIYPRKIAYNCIPQIGPILKNGFSEEEMKMVNEIKKIMNCSCDVNATTVRVPVMYGHSESVYVELEKEFDLNSVKNILKNSPSIKLWNDYPTALEVRGNDLSHVGRLRFSHNGKGLMFWNVADNVRVGAATNAVKILEYLINGQ